MLKLNLFTLNFNMKKYVNFIMFSFGTILLALFMVSLTFVAITGYPKDVFKSSYQSLIQDKFKILVNTNEPKIIMLSGSSSSFGLDQEMLEDATGYKVANLGLQNSLGAVFFSELAKANINEGDIILLGYEYNWFTTEAFEKLGVDLVMSGIDNNISMYRYIPIDKYPQLLGYLFTYANKKQNYQPATGIYSREAFDEKTGQMTWPRKNAMEYNAETDGTVDITDTTISEASIKYLISFKDYVEKHGAKIVFVAPPVLEEAIICDYAEFEKLKKQEEEKIGIPYISNPVEYFLPKELMSNAIYHCNSAGEKYRTKLLINDLKNSSIIPFEG